MRNWRLVARVSVACLVTALLPRAGVRSSADGSGGHCPSAGGEPASSGRPRPSGSGRRRATAPTTSHRTPSCPSSRSALAAFAIGSCSSSRSCQSADGSACSSRRELPPRPWRNFESVRPNSRSGKTHARHSHGWQPLRSVSRDLSKTLALLEKLAARLGERERAGDGSKFDRLRAEREVAELRAEHRIAETDLAAARASLAALMGLTGAPPLIASNSVVTGTAARSQPLPTLDLALTTARLQRADFLASDAEVRRLEFDRQAATRVGRPHPILGGGWKNTAGGGRIVERIRVLSGSRHSAFQQRPGGRRGRQFCACCGPRRT